MEAKYFFVHNFVYLLTFDVYFFFIAFTSRRKYFILILMSEHKYFIEVFYEYKTPKKYHERQPRL